MTQVSTARNVLIIKSLLRTIKTYIKGGNFQSLWATVQLVSALPALPIPDHLDQVCSVDQRLEYTILENVGVGEDQLNWCLPVCGVGTVGEQGGQWALRTGITPPGLHDKETTNKIFFWPPPDAAFKNSSLACTILFVLSLSS